MANVDVEPVKVNEMNDRQRSFQRSDNIEKTNELTLIHITL